MPTPSLEQFSLYDERFQDGRYEIYDALRTREPVFWHEETRSWFITRYVDVSAHLVGDAFLTGPLVRNKMRNVPPGEEGRFQDIVDIVSAWMVYNDRPVHTRLRSHMNRAFWSREIDLIRPEIRRIVSEQLDLVLERTGGSFDFVEAVAHPVPAMVLGRMLGIPAEEVERFIGWSDDIAAFMQDFVVKAAPDRETGARTRRSLREIVGFLTRAIEERRRSPRNDLLTRLVVRDADDSGGPGALTDAEVIRQTIHLVFGGHKIPQYLLSNCLHLLLAHPREFAALKADRARVSATVEECIRLEAPLQYVTRHAKDDIELHGRRIRGGDSVYFFLGAAGRDPEAFEDPGVFRPGRTGRRHLGFGGGYHACIAAAFARAEVEEVLLGLLDRMPGVAARYDLSRPRWTPNPTFHGIVTMPVEAEG
ncbi:cytochrome P450 [Streptomyces sp. NPDC045431]|uniref:cytochrome P450 n=1 Tax=Streptomyces sp. NPDC045431 TaxID=3155613 RepID=UPI0033C2A4F0